MKILNYLCIAGCMFIFSACKKTGSSTNNVEVRVATSQPAQTNLVVYGSDPNHPLVDTTSAYVQNFDYTFKGTSGESITVSIGASVPATISATVYDNGKVITPFSTSASTDGSAAQFVYAVP